MQYRYTMFSKPGREDTEKLLAIVNSYLLNEHISKIVVSSTTGYTAYQMEEKIKNVGVEKIICKQDISEEYSMKKDDYEYFAKKYKVFEIPKGFLKSKIGISGTNILRRVSQGFKVCVELTEFLLEVKELKACEKVLVLAGTLKGADTAVVMSICENEKYTIDTILCLPKEK